jgi:hypothetical protein
MAIRCRKSMKKPYKITEVVEDLVDRVFATRVLLGLERNTTLKKISDMWHVKDPRQHTSCSAAQ